MLYFSVGLYTKTDVAGPSARKQNMVLSPCA